MSLESDPHGGSPNDTTHHRRHLAVLHRQRRPGHARVLSRHAGDRVEAKARFAGAREMIDDGARSLSVRDTITDALRYWEPRRLLFNAALLLVVVACFFLGWPVSKQLLNHDLILGLFVLAVLANVAYCAAYVPDVIIQSS